MKNKNLKYWIPIIGLYLANKKCNVKIYSNSKYLIYQILSTFIILTALILIFGTIIIFNLIY